MTPAELAAIRARCVTARARADAATPGPWVCYTNAPEAVEARPPSGCSVDTSATESALLAAGRQRDREGRFFDDCVTDNVITRADAIFIAHARQDVPSLCEDVPRLCDEVARLTAEVERLSAMVPRWTKSKGGGVWSLVVGRAHHIATVERHYDNFRAWTRLAGEVHAMPVAVEPDLPTACRAVCARLGLHGILPPTEGT